MGMAAIVGGSIAAAGAIGSSLIASNAAGKAADAQSQSAAEANALQKYMYDTTRTDQAPWRDIGGAAIDQLKVFTTPGADLSGWLKSQPGYQAGLDQGVNAITGSRAASGLLQSGGTLKALDKFGQDYASSNLTNIYNRLTNLAGMGQTANQSTSAAGQNYANQAGQNMLAAGNAQAAGYQNQAGIQTGLLGNLTGIGSNLFSQYGRQAAPSYNFGVSGFGGGNPFGDVGSGSFGPSTSYDFGTSGMAF